MTAARKIGHLHAEGSADWCNQLANALIEVTPTARVLHLLRLGAQALGMCSAAVVRRGPDWQLLTTHHSGQRPAITLRQARAMGQYALASDEVVGATVSMGDDDPPGAWIAVPMGSHHALAFATHTARDLSFSAAEVGQARLIATLVHRELQLEEASNAQPDDLLDTLTGLPTVHGVRYRVQRVLKRAAFLEHPVMTVVVGLDDFSLLTSDHGNDVGNEILRVFGRRLEDAVRPRDLVAILDEDTFLAVLPEAELEHVQNVAARIRLAMSTTPIHTQAGPFVIPCSVGVIAATPSNATLETLIDEARRALLTARKTRKRRVKVLF